MREWNPEDIRISSDMYAECTEGALMIRRCGSCSRLFAPPVTRCSACRGDDFEQVPAAGSGSIVCWRTVTWAPDPDADAVESMIAIVELDEGPWVYTTIDGEPPRSGCRPVRVRFQAPPRGGRFPVFVINAGQALAAE
ncbi:Zn-ribbon domain-containing OB-fold protein [Nocardia sp. NBC_01329]|uniref:Zn-ribbon domain-containing OB-fold protein n=1 Tax=Nocardia sp. NBC_01329 TaxID=2903594 RepID=UPI002E117E5D|nr:zinc ribbon domain-containing protein [Nocardia sp. NBC_01329]